MYDPKGNGKERGVPAVTFHEAPPPDHLASFVHRFLELETEEPLEADYRFHALPDACTYLVFDQSQRDIAGVTKLRASSEEMNLGRRFHYVNIRFLPGVWRGDGVEYGMVDAPYAGDLPLVEVNRRLAGLSFGDKQSVLADLVGHLIDKGLIAANPITEKIFARIEDVYSVADMAEIAGMSARQLQRSLQRTTGFAPHDFLKVLRLQQALQDEPSLTYADQSHFIHSFKKATGYTPGRYAKKFDV